MIVFAGMSPHPPIIIPGVGKGEEIKIKKTAEALERLAGELAASEPDTVIIVSSHMVHYPQLFNVCGMKELVGSFENFDFSEYSWSGSNNLELAEEIVDKSEAEGLPAILYNNGETSYELDHGVMVPNYFISQKMEFAYKILPIGYSIASRALHYSFGQVISEVCESKRDERVAIIASGDLSHRLNHGAPAGFNEEGAKFDKEIISLLKKGDDYSIMNMPEDFVEAAGECGYRSILITLGALSGRDYKPEIYSYEGPFGVGYMVANLNIKS